MRLLHLLGIIEEGPETGLLPRITGGPGRLVWESFARQQVLRHGAGQVGGGVVAGVIPIHTAPQAVLQDIQAFLADGADIVEAQHETSFRVGIIRHFRDRVPDLLVARLRRRQFPEVDEVAVAVPAASVERHAHDEFLRRDAGLQMGLHGFVRAELPADGALVQGCVVAGRPAHVVGHHVDPVQEGKDGREIHVTGAAHRSHGQQAVRPEGVAQVLHQESEVARIVRRTGDARR